MRTLIGICGQKAVGKDTAAGFLVAERGFKRIAFADRLYDEVASAFNVTTEFLGRRESKETELPELALKNCSEPAFIPVIHSLFPGISEQELLEKPLSPRTLLQQWGTEFKRKDNDRYWLDQVDQQLTDDPDSNYVITDVRFLAELNYLQEKNAVIARVRMRSVEIAEQSGVKHSSEEFALKIPVDFELFNKRNSLEQLRLGVLQMVDSLNQKKAA